MLQAPQNGRNQSLRDGVHLLVGSAFGLSLGLVFWHFMRTEDDPDVRRYREVRDFVQTHYVRELSNDQILDEALDGMVRSLDPYSRYYGPAEVATIERETSGQYQGIGVVFASPTQEARVLYTLPGSPAEKAGVRIGDQLLRIGERAVADMSNAEMRKSLGARGSGEVRLTLLGRDKLERVVDIGRDELIDPTVRHVRIVDEKLGLGYLAITSFTQETSDEFDRAVRGLRELGMRGLIVDVRGNLGGVLRGATRIANRFLAEGRIVSHEGRAETAHYDADPDAALFQGTPLVILVDGESASASEVFAAALQEHRVAVVVGSPTYGKGMVQQVRSFGRGEMIVKLISAYYYTPSHRNIERTVDGAWDHGLMPDVRVDLDKAETDSVRAFLASYSPPEHALAELSAWEREEGRELYPRPPRDGQLDAALALLRGQRPETLARTGQ